MPQRHPLNIITARPLGPKNSNRHPNDGTGNTTTYYTWRKPSQPTTTSYTIINGDETLKAGVTVSQLNYLGNMGVTGNYGIPRAWNCGRYQLVSNANVEEYRAEQANKEKKPKRDRNARKFITTSRKDTFVEVVDGISRREQQDHRVICEVIAKYGRATTDMVCVFVCCLQVRDCSHL